MIFLLLDGRHLPSQLDKQMIEFLLFNNLPFKIIITKSDKLSKSKLTENINSIAKTLNLRKEIFITSSSYSRQGRQSILDLISFKLEEFYGKEDKN